MQKEFDIIIVGSGIIGATAAIALARQTRLRIAVLDMKKITHLLQLNQYGTRVSAISATSRQIFSNLQVWPAIKGKRVSPYVKMHVWDAAGDGKLDFASAAMGAANLGHIIEDDVIRASLTENFKNYPNIEVIAPVTLTHLLADEPDGITLLADNQYRYRARLLLAADGAHSWLRQQAGITLHSRAYQQSAIVTTVRTALPHHATAYQCFLASGPLAFLPLSEPHTAAIVWSTTTAAAAHLLTLSEQDFCRELAKAFSCKLGAVESATARFSYPLLMRHATQYVKPRFVLLGDAAHTLHPLAGQGVNLGLLDVACLVEVIDDALQAQRDFTSVATLRRYERWRKAENQTMLAFVDGINYLYTTNNTALTSLRLCGLNMLDRMQFIKEFFANYAAGKRSGLPALASVVSHAN